MQFYTNETIKILAVQGAATLAYKSPGAATVQVSLAGGGTSDGSLFFSTVITTPGGFFYQQMDADGTVLETGEFTVLQDLAHAATTYDPRSLAEQTLEALDQKIAGRALTIQQSKITVGDRSIEYINSIQELQKWRSYYARIVAKEHGKTGDPTAMVYTIRSR